MGIEAHWHREQRDARELLRLDLIGLAAEVFTLSVRIEEEIRRAPSPHVQGLAACREALSVRARSLLDLRTRFDVMMADAMAGSLHKLREDQRQMLALRCEVSAHLQRERGQ